MQGPVSGQISQLHGEAYFENWKGCFLGVKRMKKRESFSSKPILARPMQICVSWLIRSKRTNDLDTQRVITIGMFEIYEQLLPTRTRLWASSRPNRVLLVILPAGCAIQHQRAWLIYSMLVLRWQKQSTWQGMTRSWKSCFFDNTEDAAVVFTN